MPILRTILPQRRKSKVRWLVAVVSCLACVLLSNLVVLMVAFQDLRMNNALGSSPRRLEVNSQDAVHIVTTRFMQHQPSLLALGHARLKLFETFCLRTMVYQNTLDFIWLILVDPELHPELLERMKQYVSPYPNFYVIQCETSTVDVRWLNHSVIESGNIQHLLNVAQVMSSRVVLHTRLDADDGLDRRVLRTIKHKAVQQLSNKQGDSKGWESYCIHRHFEWHSIVPPIANETNAINPAGNLLVVQKYHCVTPGMTYAFAPGVSFSQIPSANHNLLGNVIPPCTNQSQTACLRRLDEFRGPVSIRARTLTSAGMSDIGRDFDPTVSSIPPFYYCLKKNFDISRQSLVDLQSYLNEHSAEIAKDNLDGQCTKGHSCKESSKIQLQKVLAANWTKQPERRNATDARSLNHN